MGHAFQPQFPQPYVSLLLPKFGLTSMVEVGKYQIGVRRNYGESTKDGSPRNR
jgi:hypothetical protein